MRKVAALLAVLVLTGGCFGVGEKHSVVVNKVAVNLVFGHQPPPSFTGPTPVVRPSYGYFGEPIFIYDYPSPIPGPRQLPDPCPAAQPGTFPEEPATTDVENKPVPGVYTYRNKGTSAGLSPSTTYLRTIHDIKAIGDASNTGQFQYTIDNGLGYNQYSIGGPVSQAVFTVRPRGTDPNPVDPGVLPVPGHAAVLPDGVYLTALTMNTIPTTFVYHAPAGALGVQLLQLPAANGKQWASSSQDQADGTSISFTGGINPNNDVKQTGKELVDACGQLIEAWAVDGTLAITGASFTATDTIHFDIVPQYGGWVVFEGHNITNGVADPPLAPNLAGSKYEEKVSGLHPKPLPKGVTP